MTSSDDLSRTPAIETDASSRRNAGAAGRSCAAACAGILALVAGLCCPGAPVQAEDAPQSAQAGAGALPGGALDRVDMAPKDFLTMVAKIRAVGDLRQYEKVVPLIPFPVVEVQRPTDGPVSGDSRLAEPEGHVLNFISRWRRAFAAMVSACSITCAVACLVPAVG